MSEMTGNKEAVSVLGSLLRSSNDPCPLILLGAGASFRSGVPTAADAVKRIARLVYSERELRDPRPPERVKPSEWEAWLQGFDWFLPGAESDANRIVGGFDPMGSADNVEVCSGPYRNS